MQELKESAARGNPYAMQELATANGQSQKHVDKLFRTCFSRDPAKAAAAKQELINLAEEDVLAKQQLDNLEERKAKLANTARQKSKTPANNEDLYAKFRARRATTIAKSSRAPQTGAAPTSDAVSAVPAPSACGSGDLLENDSEEWYIIGDDDEDMGDEGMETDFE
jgi:hypothetical protein